mgnify:CR=1 FL=1
MDPKKEMYRKRGAILAGNLTRRQFDAYYCDSREEALQKALELVPDGATVGWGGAMSAQQIGLMDALRSKPVTLFDRETAQSQEERTAILKQCLTANVFLTGANALSLDGQMVNIDGTGNRAAAIAFGPDTVLVTSAILFEIPMVDQVDPAFYQEVKENDTIEIDADAGLVKIL